VLATVPTQSLRVGYQSEQTCFEIGSPVSQSTQTGIEGLGWFVDLDPLRLDRILDRSKNRYDSIISLLVRIHIFGCKFNVFNNIDCQKYRFKFDWPPQISLLNFFKNVSLMLYKWLNDIQYFINTNYIIQFCIFGITWIWKLWYSIIQIYFYCIDWLP
jgi:hypothetical protein